MNHSHSPDTALTLYLATTPLQTVEAFEPTSVVGPRTGVIAAAGVALRQIIEALSAQAS
jgi:hypothetical protein